MFWSFYFLGKIFLYFMGAIRFDFVMNILFAFFLLLPVPERMPAHKGLKTLRVIAAVPAAFLLFWHETWFPPLGYAFHHLTGANAMSAGYMLQFVLENINPVMVAGLVVLFILCRFAAKRLNFNTVLPVTFLMLILLLMHVFGARPAAAAQAPHGKETPGAYFDAFHRSEAKRMVRFVKPAKGAPPFDIVILHI